MDKIRPVVWMILFAVWSACAVVARPSAGVQAADRPPVVLRRIVAPATADNPRNTEGSMVRLRDGRILFAWTAFDRGQSEDHAPARIVAAQSSDGGRSWRSL
jgi:hypothetical protein